ncbi:SUMF1/EgtB/PvdO family nonheme iron enzyme [Streptomyces sp. NPDC007162]|uniref:formylglycine-generating enzyme family protein n=1 Tax=Streptomyces sp. NPDC007162 TaxID=3156917 RepID=UPI0033DCFC0D
MSDAVDPAVVVGEINSLPPRAAMGLPERWTACFHEQIENEVSDLRFAPLPELTRLAESEQGAAANRLAAGLLLALLGDVRIDPMKPSMIDVPGAGVRLGTTETEATRISETHRRQGVKRSWILKECPEHTVVVADYRIARYPVTNLEYRAFLKENPSAGIPTSWHLGRYPAERANQPVFSLRPESADRYCRWLSEATGRRFRLPTEAEWEYAAAGPERNAFPWGDEYQPGLCNCVEEGIMTTTPVGMFAAGRSWVGAHDMAGNVEEYVADGYRPYPGGQVVEDDLYTTLGADYRVARGGAFNRFHDMARTRRRHGGPLNLDFYAMGFRVAETP